MNFLASINYNKIITFPERDTGFDYENVDAAKFKAKSSAVTTLNIL